MAGCAPTRVGEPIFSGRGRRITALGVLLPLFQRAQTGEGQHVDVAMLDAMMSLQMITLSQIIGGAAVPGRIGNAPY